MGRDGDRNRNPTDRVLPSLPRMLAALGGRGQYFVFSDSQRTREQEPGSVGWMTLRLTERNSRRAVFAKMAACKLGPNSPFA